MKNTFGSALSLTVFGESHGAAIGGVLDGLPAGIKIDYENIDKMLSFRRGEEEISTPRRESDKVRFLSGVYKNRTCGTPVSFVIENTNINLKPYEKTAYLPRPSHSDFAAFFRNGSYGDYNGGGHFSGRVTAVITVAGAIILPLLKAKGIEIGTHVCEIGGIKDRDFADYEKDIRATRKLFPVFDKKAGDAMRERILDAKHSGDSVGGILGTAIIGMPKGVGEPFFDTLEGMISHAVFSIPAVKGIEFGLGFGFGNASGSESNDQMYAENGEILFKSNNSGGVLGGLSNGEPIVFKTAVKPTPTISVAQTTVNMKTKKTQVLKSFGRNDPCIVPRAAVVQTSVSALCVADACIQKFGTDWICE